MTTDFDGRRKQISEAAEAYAAGAWHSSWPAFLLALSLGVWLGVLTAVSLAVVRAGQHGTLVPRTGGLIVVALLVLELGGAVAILIGFRRWHAHWRAAHTEVVLAAPQERYPWLRSVVAVAIIPLWYFVFGRLFQEASVSLQPLLWAGLLVFIIGLDMLIDLVRRATPAWKRCPTALFVIGAYALYAAAVALGARQPWEHVPGAVGFLLRIGVTQGIVAVLVVVLGELHSRRQLRRLQRLVNDVPPADSHGTH